MLSPLSQLDDWELEDEANDVRGWPVEDARGRGMGSVVDLVVNTDAGVVESVITDTGERFAASDLLVGDGFVYLESAPLGPAEPTRPGERAYGTARVRRKVG